MIQYLGYGILLAIGYHIGGKVAKRFNLGPDDKENVKLFKGIGIKTSKYASKIEGKF